MFLLFQGVIGRRGDSENVAIVRYGMVVGRRVDAMPDSLVRVDRRRLGVGGAGTLVGAGECLDEGLATF